jgi:hypothetical protein
VRRALYHDTVLITRYYEIIIIPTFDCLILSRASERVAQLVSKLRKQYALHLYLSTAAAAAVSVRFKLALILNGWKTVHI